ncbi:hypothetical protein DXG01_003754 [Tephrocybe rancida]|nr:hypothetical protein DXG01_003754 [Tephrocybe rancida]
MAAVAPQDAFSRAWKTYTELLTASELSKIKFPTSLSELISQAQAISDSFESSRLAQSTPLSQRLGAATLKLQPFERILEGLAKLSPEAGQLIWGSISLILEMTRNNAEVLEETMDFFVAMAGEMEYVALLETTFSAAPLVVTVIESLYVAVLNFWVKAVKYYRPKPSQRARILSAVKQFVSSGYMLQEFRKLKTKIGTEKERLHHVASAQHYTGSALYHQQSQREGATARRLRQVAWINAPSYEADLHVAEKRRYTGTCEWTRNKAAYASWAASEENLFLMIYGIPGAGKTILSSWLVNEAFTRAVENDGIVLFHFFKASDDSKNTPLAAMRSLIDQLYDHMCQKPHHLLPELESELDTLSHKNHISFTRLWAVLSSFITKLQCPSSPSLLTTVTIVLDAMDECKGSKPLVRELRKHVQTSSGAARIIVTSRKVGGHVDELAMEPMNRLLILHITKDDVKRDIASFTRHKIGKIERLQGERHLDLRNNVIAALGKVENHEGMFLWTYLMCKEVKHLLEVSSIWHLMQNLPRGLDATYARICNRLAGNERHREFGRSVLRWIVASRRPLRFAELEQALKTMQTKDSATGEFLENPAVFDKEFGLGLLWSRKDIVEVCGDLVTYTGLDDGDMIGLIHLSARQFLCCDPGQLSLPLDLIPVAANIQMFPVDISQAECQLGSTCLEYLFMEELKSDVYFGLLPGGLEVDRSRRQSFAKRHPFFDYAIVYWPEYAVNVFDRFSGSVDNMRLASKTLCFVTHPICIVWLEEYIHQFGIEMTTYTIRRFSGLTSTPAPRELLRWAEEVTNMFDRYSVTLRTYPSAIRKCLLPLDGLQNVFQQHCQVLVESDSTDNHHNINASISPPIYPTLERASRGWLHHDWLTDTVLSVERSSKMPSLRRQVLATGMRFRPALFEDHNGTTDFSVRSARVSARMGFVAVTFSSVMHGVNSFTTVCWSLVTSMARPSDDWAQVAFVETLEGPQLSKFEFSSTLGLSVIAFGADNTLITPGGIWDILTEERTDGPAAIFDPDPQLEVRDTGFSGNGERVARLVTRTSHRAVEILDIHGKHLCSMEFLMSAHNQDLHLVAISETGKKIVIQKTELEKDSLGNLQAVSSFVCFETESGTPISISLPELGNGTCLKSIVFTKDEDRMISYILSFEPNPFRPIGSIGVWNFSKDCEGRWCDSASPVSLFKDDHFPHIGIELCLTQLPMVSGAPQLHESLIIVTDLEHVHRRGVMGPYRSWREENRDLVSRPTRLKHKSSFSEVLFEKVVRRKNGSLELLTGFQSRASDFQQVLHLEKWLITPPKLQMLPTVLISPKLVDIHCDITSTGSFLFAHNNQEIYQIKTSDGIELTALPVNLPFTKNTIIGCTFAADDTRVAFLRHPEGDQLWLSIFDIIDGDFVDERTSQFPDVPSNDHQQDDFDDTLLVQMAFGGNCSELLAISYSGSSLDEWGPPHMVTVCLNIVHDINQYLQINDDLFVPSLQFSNCGRYIYNNSDDEELTLYPIPALLAQPRGDTPPSANCARAVLPTMTLGKRYVHSPYTWELSFAGRALSLHRRRLTDLGKPIYSTHLLCVLPDASFDGQSLTVIWPPDKLDHIVVVLRDQSKTRKVVAIDTGTPSFEMTGEDLEA